MKECSACHGKGASQKPQRTIFGSAQVQHPCVDCRGQGGVPEQPCSRCKGFGIEKRQKGNPCRDSCRNFRRRINSRNREGEHPGRGAKPGDLFLRIHVSSHPTFTREAGDIRSIVDIPYSTTMLGGNVDVETVDGPVTLKIPEGTQTGTIFKLRGKGVPFLRSHGRGGSLRHGTSES